jgi:hypothetical protein
VDLEAWYAGLPLFLRSLDLVPSTGDPILLKSDIKALGYRLMMFHTAYVLLCSPADDEKDDTLWILSEAFVTAQEHGLRTTAWLRCMLDGRHTPSFATGVSFKARFERADG